MYRRFIRNICSLTLSRFPVCVITSGSTGLDPGYGDFPCLYHNIEELDLERETIDPIKKLWFAPVTEYGRLQFYIRIIYAFLF
jgi:hypothetical protein